MSTAESVKAQLESLLAQANSTTGNEDSTLTAAVSALVAGFGKGSGVQMLSGTFTPAENTPECRITGLDGSPSAFALAPAFSTEEAYNGVTKLLAFIWVRGVWALFRTNVSGTINTCDNFDTFNLESFTIREDDYNTGSSIVEVLKTGFLAHRGGYYFREGLTYNWAAII